MIVQPMVVSASLWSPPTDPSIGDCYLVAAGAAEDWSGKDLQFAMMGSGGWVFLEPFAGLEVRDVSQGVRLRYDGVNWQVAAHRGPVEDANGVPVVSSRQSAVSLPAGGAVVDVEARDAIGSLVARLVSHGLIEAN